MTATTALQDLTPYIDASGNWSWQSPGYYVHQGRVYLDGAIDNSTPIGGGGAVTQAILTGLPTALRPATAVHVNLPILPDGTDDTCNPATNVPILWAATIHTDGTMTLDDAIPDQVNTTPPIGDWFYYNSLEPTSGLSQQYGDPVFVTLALGNTSWPIATLSDAYVSLPEPPGSDFTQVDGTSSVHGSRVHLDGHYAAVTVGGDVQLVNDPVLTTGITPEAFDSISTAPAHDPPLGLYVGSSGNVYVSQDRIIRPTDQTPVICMSSPQYNNMSDTGGGLGGHRGPEGGFNYVTPFVPGVGDTPSSGRGTVSGVQTFADGAYHVCPPGSDPTHDLAHYCPDAASIPPVTINLSDLYSQVAPDCDWFLVLLNGVSAAGATPIVATTPCSLSDGRFCGPTITLGGFYSVSNCAVVHGDMTNVAAVTGGGSVELQIGAYVVPAHPQFQGSVVVNGSSGISNPAQLWHKSQVVAPGSFEIQFQDELGPYCGLIGGGPVEPALLTWSFSIAPFWEQRQIGLQAGERLDLTGVGWVGTTDSPIPPPSPPPAQINAGPSSAGLIRLS